MSLMLYLPPGDLRLAEYRLRTLAPGTPVHLIDGGADEAQVAALRARHPSALAPVPLRDAAALTARVREAQLDSVCIPAALPSVPATYAWPLERPDPSPWYPLVRDLWQCGLRRFEFCSFHGARTLEVPLLPHALVDRHKGRRCFVVGNGPSLNQLDMPRLRDEITLGSNRGYLGFDRWGFAFDYWACTDRLQLEEFLPEYEAQLPPEVVKVIPFEYLAMAHLDNACPVRLDIARERAHQFSTEPDRLFRGYSVTFTLLQLAAIMGCDPIILIGVDHRYELRRTLPFTRWARLGGRWLAQRYQGSQAWAMAEAALHARYRQRNAPSQPGPARLWHAGDAATPTHFDERYTTGAPKRFLRPRPRDMERDYTEARRWADTHGRRILNATPGSALEVFPRAQFEDLF